MAATIKTAISIQKTLFDQAEILAQQLNISQSQLFETAIENYINSHQSQTHLDDINPPNENQPGPIEPEGSPSQDTNTTTKIVEGQRIINQGDLYWVRLEEPGGFEPGYTHPYVVIQDNLINHSRVNTVVVCALTSNLKRAKAPGNVLLEVDEANLPRQSVVEVSKISSVDKTQLGEPIGSLTDRRIDQIMAGIQFLQLLAEHHENSKKK